MYVGASLLNPIVPRQPHVQHAIFDVSRHFLSTDEHAFDFVVVDEREAYQGMVRGRDIRTALLQPEAVSLLVVAELLSPGVPTVKPGETLDIILDKFAGNEVESLPVCRAGDDTYIEGLITRQAVMRRYQEELDRQMG